MQRTPLAAFVTDLGTMPKVAQLDQGQRLSVSPRAQPSCLIEYNLTLHFAFER